MHKFIWVSQSHGLKIIMFIILTALVGTYLHGLMIHHSFLLIMLPALGLLLQLQIHAISLGLNISLLAYTTNTPAIQVFHVIVTINTTTH
jgi:hypothetical protein